MSSPEKAIEQYASSHYGHLILVDNPLHDPQEGFYVSNLRSDYPLIIKDDKPPKKKSIHVLEIENLGFITLDKNFKIVKDRTTSREECIRNIDSFFEMWKKRAEEIVVAASSDNLSRSLRFNHFFDPIDEILDSLWESHCVDDVEIDFNRSPARRRKTRLYLGLLEGLQIVRKEVSGYSEGNLTISLLEEYKGNEIGFRDAVISTLLRERYPTLRDIFKLTILEPTIHVDNCVYLPEMEIEEQVHRKVESIQHDFAHYYHRPINTRALKRYLRQLVSVDAIEQEGEHYFGNKTLLNKMIKIKKTCMPISRELQVRA